eukprot:3121254-Pyramimonas_sp.AAC.1
MGTVRRGSCNSPPATRSYTTLHEVTPCYIQLRSNAPICSRLHSGTPGYGEMRSDTPMYIQLHAIVRYVQLAFEIGACCGLLMKS